MLARCAGGRRWLGAALAGFSLFAPTVNAAAAVQVPPGCGSELEFTVEVQKRLGAGVEPLPTSFRITPERGGYVLSMQVGNEQRELRDPSCRELFRAAVVVAATIALSEARRANPALGDEIAPAPQATPAEAPPAATPVERQPASPPKPSAPPVPRATVTLKGDVSAAPIPESSSTAPSAAALSMALGAGAFVGVTPELAPRFDLEVRLTVSEFGVVAGGCWFPSSSGTDAAGRGVEVSGFRAALAGVWLPLELLEARLGGSVYRLTGTGLGSFGHRSDGAWSGGLMAGILVAPLRHGRLWAGAALEGEWLLVRSRFEILNYREVFRVSQVSAAGLLKLGVQAF